jgi:hypothetical protein
MKRSCNIVWLIEDRPDDAARDLEQASWTVPGGYHVQHWHLLLATGEIALYQRRAAETEARWREEFAALERSLLLNIQFIRAESRWLLGRLALAVGTDAGRAEARRIAAQLAREKTSYGTVWGAMLRAACAHRQKKDAEAAAALREAIAAADGAGMLLCAHASRRRLGEIQGGDEGARLCAEASAWMERECVRNPARLLSVIVPGFADAPPPPAAG